MTHAQDKTYSLEAGEKLMDDLVRHAVSSPKRTYLHEWQVGDLLLWDQFSVFHRARPYDPAEPRRLFAE